MQGALEIRHCRALIAVADEGGIARAAAVLGVAQSTLSETLISLERAMGARLVLRQRGIEARLTGAAQILLPHARRIAAAADAATAEVSAQANILRVGAVESISSYFLPSATQAMRNRYPALRVQVTAGLCTNLQAQVRDGELDVAILLRGLDAPSERDLIVRQLGTTRLRLVVKRGGTLSGGWFSAAALARLGVVVPDPYGPINDVMESWFSAGGVAARLVSAGSLDAVRQSVLIDGAVGLLPAYAVDHENASDAMVDIRVDRDLPELAMRAATGGLAAAPDVLETLLDFIGRDIEAVKGRNDVS